MALFWGFLRDKLEKSEHACLPFELERVQACTRWHFAFACMLSMRVMCYVVIVTKPVHRSQIRDRNSAQLGGTPTIPPSYVRVRAAVWACGRGQTDRHIHTHRRAWPLYISRRLRLTRYV